MFPHVRQKSVSCVERPRTHVARVGPQSRVLHHVLLKVRAMLESAAAHFAYLGFFASVRAHVHGKRCTRVERARASVAAVSRPLSRFGRQHVLTSGRSVTTHVTRPRMLRLYTHHQRPILTRNAGWLLFRACLMHCKYKQSCSATVSLTKKKFQCPGFHSTES